MRYTPSAYRVLASRQLSRPRQSWVVARIWFVQVHGTHQVLPCEWWRVKSSQLQLPSLTIARSRLWSTATTEIHYGKYLIIDFTNSGSRFSSGGSCSIEDFTFFTSLSYISTTPLYASYFGQTIENIGFSVVKPHNLYLSWDQINSPHIMKCLETQLHKLN